MRRRRAASNLVGLVVVLCLALLGRFGNADLQKLLAEAAPTDSHPAAAPADPAPPTPTDQQPDPAPTQQPTRATTDPVAATTKPTQAAPTGETVIVSRVIDGDTVELADGRKVRYIGMDTPEITKGKNECFGQEAAAHNSGLVLGKTVRLTKDVSETDRYGRLLRFVWVGDALVNATMLRDGYAAILTIPPDVTKAEEFKQLQAEARSVGRGLWASCGSVHAKISTP